MQDLVAVGVADAGDERLVAQQVLELTRMAPDPVAPDLERQRRVVGVRPLLLLTEPRDRAIHAGGPQVDLAHLGRVLVADLRRRVVGRQPAGAARPCRGVPRASRARPEPEDDRRLGRQLRPGVASWKRPVSMGLTAIASRSRSISRNLPRRRMAATVWPTRAASSAGVPRTASGPGVSTDSTVGPRRPHGGRRRPRTDRGIRARAAIVARKGLC